jgi:hypothetical protein
VSALDVIRADLRAAGRPVVDANGDGPGLDSTCPACGGRPLWVRARDDGSFALRCESGCSPSRIADELRFEREKNGTLNTDTTASSWAPVPLAGIVAGTETDEPPAVLRRSDGYALIYPGRVHAMFGEPEACKGWLALAACVQELAEGRRVLYVDFEDTAASVVGRLLALGADQGAVLDGFVYVRPEEGLNEHSQAEVLRAASGVSLAVLDGVTEALALQGLDLASNSDIAAWLEMLPRPLARADCAVLTIDHVVKDREARGRYAIGAQHKLAGVDVAYAVSVISPFGRGRDGRVKMTVTKDRPGHVRGIADEGRVADVRLASLHDGGVRVTFEAPGESAGGRFRPTSIMERVSRALEEQPGLSKRSIRTAVKGRANVVDLALEILVAEGYVTARRDGQAVLHDSAREYRSTDDQTDRVPPCPNRVPDTVVDPCPPPPIPNGRDTGTRSRARRSPPTVSRRSRTAPNGCSSTTPTSTNRPDGPVPQLSRPTRTRHLRPPELHAHHHHHGDHAVAHDPVRPGARTTRRTTRPRTRTHRRRRPPRTTHPTSGLTRPRRSRHPPRHRPRPAHARPRRHAPHPHHRRGRMTPQHIDTLLTGVERWHLAVVQALADGHTGRHVALTLEPTANQPPLPPLTFVIDPDTAREISQALSHYAGQANQRDHGDRN